MLVGQLFLCIFTIKRGFPYEIMIIMKKEDFLIMITLDIDLLNYRTYVAPNKVYYDRPQK